MKMTRTRGNLFEDQVKGWVPVGIDVTLTSHPDWKSSSPALVAEFDFKAEGWAIQAGRGETC